MMWFIKLSEIFITSFDLYQIERLRITTCCLFLRKKKKTIPKSTRIKSQAVASIKCFKNLYEIEHRLNKYEKLSTDGIEKHAEQCLFAWNVLPLPKAEIDFSCVNLLLLS